MLMHISEGARQEGQAQSLARNRTGQAKAMLGSQGGQNWLTLREI